MKTPDLIIIDKNFNPYIPEIYGSKTWGNGYRQEEMYHDEKGKWVIHTWRYGGEWEEDTDDYCTLEIIAEFNSLTKARRFLKQNRKMDKLKDLETQYNDFKRWYEAFKKESKKRKRKNK